MSTASITHYHPSGRWGDHLKLVAGQQFHIPRPPPSSWIALKAPSATLLEARVPCLIGYKQFPEHVEWRVVVDLINPSPVPTDASFTWINCPTKAVLLWNNKHLCRLKLTITKGFQEALPSLALQISLRESRFPCRVSLLPPFVVELALQSATPSALVRNITQWKNGITSSPLL